MARDGTNIQTEKERLLFMKWGLRTVASLHSHNTKFTEDMGMRESLLHMLCYQAFSRRAMPDAYKEHDVRAGLTSYKCDSKNVGKNIHFGGQIS